MEHTTILTDKPFHRIKISILDGRLVTQNVCIWNECSYHKVKT